CDILVYVLAILLLLVIFFCLLHLFFFFFFFFFQAEDGIRDSSVTGVQTCALPIFKELLKQVNVEELSDELRLIMRTETSQIKKRSEERRVGKECRSRWWP